MSRRPAPVDPVAAAEAAAAGEAAMEVAHRFGSPVPLRVWQAQRMTSNTQPARHIVWTGRRAYWRELGADLWEREGGGVRAGTAVALALTALWALAVAGILLSVVAAFYYLRLIKVMVMDKAQARFDTPLGIPSWTLAIAALMVSVGYIPLLAPFLRLVGG